MRFFTAETRRRGEESRDRIIGSSDHRVTGIHLSPISDGTPQSASIQQTGFQFSAPPRLRGEFRIWIAGLGVRLWKIVFATLREIFDENAYDRFLARTHAARSAQSYREFLRDRETSAAQRPRCC